MIDTEKLCEMLYERGLLKRDIGLSKIEISIPRHGNCCTCQTCGWEHGECVCEHNGWVDFILSSDVSIEQLKELLK